MPQRCKIVMRKCDGARFSKKNHFRPEVCRKNRFFGIFSRFHHQFFLFFFWFFAQRCGNVQNMAESDFWEKNFFLLEMPEIAVFKEFRCPTFRCFFFIHEFFLYSFAIMLFHSFARSFVFSTFLTSLFLTNKDPKLSFRRGT